MTNYAMTFASDAGVPAARPAVLRPAAWTARALAPVCTVVAHPGVVAAATAVPANADVARKRTAVPAAAVRAAVKATAAWGPPV